MAQTRRTTRFLPRHVVAVAAFDGVVPFDLTTPCEVFERTQLADGQAPYEVRVCGVSRTVTTRAFQLTTRFGLGSLRAADTVVLPGVADLDAPLSRALLDAVRAAAARGARVVSICTGAFVLAATGLLDGRVATTHWLAAAELARRFPSVRVDPNVLYVDAGMVLTSAGAAAGLDLCLHLVRRDFGAAVAAQTARCSVMPLERPGGQAQFISHAEPSPDGASLGPLLAWAERHLTHELHAAALAKRAALSLRTLHRRFDEQLDQSPAEWVARARVRRAQVLLEQTAHSIERVADEVGFGSANAFRVRFRRLVGTSPLDYRRAFR
jgi:transcriptional regulator GlxA family with amidase domain